MQILHRELKIDLKADFVARRKAGFNKIRAVGIPFTIFTVLALKVIFFQELHSHSELIVMVVIEVFVGVYLMSVLHSKRANRLKSHSQTSPEAKEIYELMLQFYALVMQLETAKTNLESEESPDLIKEKMLILKRKIAKIVHGERSRLRRLESKTVEKTAELTAVILTSEISAELVEQVEFASTAPEIIIKNESSILPPTIGRKGLRIAP